MTKGRVTCEILKQIRADIAKANQIDYAPEVCSFKGECAGTCPKCEQELQFLELQLIKKRRVNNPVAIAGVALGLMASITACSSASKNETKSNSTVSPNLEVAHNALHRDSLIVHNNGLPIQNFKTKHKNYPAKSQDSKVNEIDANLFPDSLTSVIHDTTQLGIDSIKLPEINVFAQIPIFDYESVMCGGISIQSDNSFFSNDIYRYRYPKITNYVNFQNYPYFNDNPDSLENYIESKFLYPSNVKIKQTTIILNFLVNKEGSLSSINISKSLHKDIDNQIKTIFSNMPNWNPARDTLSRKYEVVMIVKLKITPTEVKVISVKKERVIY